MHSRFSEAEDDQHPFGATVLPQYLAGFYSLVSLARHSLTHSFIHSSTHSSLPILILPSGGSFVVAGSFDACVTAAVYLPRPTAIRAACLL